MRKRAVAVLGGRAGNAGQAALDLAEAIGAELGRRGYGIVSGGDRGVAEAANRGCLSAGGQTLALLKWNRLDECGPEVTWSVPTSMDLARSNILNWSGDGIIAFEGRYGTLSEIALALDTAKPLVVVGEQPFIDPSALDVPTCRVFRSPSPSNAAAVVDALESLIALVEAPPVRPAAALLTADLELDGDIGLRRAVPPDLDMFKRAFADSAVLEWWNPGTGDEALARFLHERCLAITEDGRSVGFIEYHADPNPDFDRISLDIVIADQDRRARGIGTTALAGFVRAVFEAGHHRVIVMPSPGNNAAIRCFEKVGFQRVGLMRDYERHDGSWRDALLFDVLPRDLRLAISSAGSR